MAPSIWRPFAVLVFAWLLTGCEPKDADYIREAEQAYAPRSDSLCCPDTCKPADRALCSFLKDSRIQQTTVNVTQGHGVMLHEVVLDVGGPNGKGRCTFHYWNSGPKIQADINVRGPQCVPST